MAIIIIIGALALMGLSNTELAQNEPPQQEAKIVRVEEVTALIVQDSTGAVVRRIPVSGREEYNVVRREERIRNPLKAGEGTRPEIPDPRVEFRDENGRVVKTISTKRVITTRTEKLNLDGTEKTYTIERSAGSIPIINKNGKYLLLLQGSGDVSHTGPDRKKVEYYESSNTTRQLIFYNVRGNVLFEKLLPKEDPLGPIGNQFISDNGEVIVINIAWVLGTIDDPRNIVLNKSGMEIMTIREATPHYLSPNGKYLAVWTNNITRFYNTTNQQYWDAPARYVVFSITPDGLANVAEYKSPVSLKIDLKQYIKE